MSSARVVWFCGDGDIEFEIRRKFCHTCHTLVSFRCVPSGKVSIYNHYTRHVRSCRLCNPNYIIQQQRKKTRQRIRTRTLMNRIDRSNITILFTQGIVIFVAIFMYVVIHFCCAFCKYLDGQAPWSLWSRSDEVLRAHISLNRSQFDLLYEKCSNALLDLRLHNQHHYVSGRKLFYYTPRNMLAITVYYLRHYPSQRLMAAQLSSHKQNVAK